MTATDELRNALVWHDYALRELTDAVTFMFRATHPDTKPDSRQEARRLAAKRINAAFNAIERSGVVKTIGEGE